MIWTLWLLLVAALLFAAMMSITRACLATAARTKPAAAKRLRNNRIRALDIAACAIGRSLLGPERLRECREICRRHGRHRAHRPL